MERLAGIEPASLTWKANALAIVLQARANGERGVGGRPTGPAAVAAGESLVFPVWPVLSTGFFRQSLDNVLGYRFIPLGRPYRA